MHLNGLLHQSPHVSVAHVQAGTGVSAGTCVRVPSMRMALSAADALPLNRKREGSFSAPLAGATIDDAHHEIPRTLPLSLRRRGLALFCCSMQRCLLDGSGP